MDGFGDAPVRVDRRGQVVRWSAEAARRVIARTAEGEPLLAMCKEPGMPALRTVMQWMAKRPDFAASLHEARRVGGGPFNGRKSIYCVETAQAIFDRLSDGEGIVAICRDPTMPGYSTVQRWIRENQEFREAMATARDLHAERAFERGREICEGVTPKTAQAAKVQLAHLRWEAGRLAPRKYGAIRPVEAPAEDMSGDLGEARGGGLNVYVKKFILDPSGGPGRESDEPAELLYSMTPSQLAGEFMDNERHPATVAWEARAPEREAAMAAFFARKRARIAINGNVIGGDPDPDYWDELARRAQARMAAGAEAPDYRGAAAELAAEGRTEDK
jgi:hypothetical protein